VEIIRGSRLQHVLAEQRVTLSSICELNHH